MKRASLQQAEVPQRDAANHSQAQGNGHLQRDIKTRIKMLTDELAGPRKGGARTGPSHSVRPEGAAQIALLGPPNSGSHNCITD